MFTKNQIPDCMDHEALVAFCDNNLDKGIMREFLRRQMKIFTALSNIVTKYNMVDAWTVNEWRENGNTELSEIGEENRAYIAIDDPSATAPTRTTSSLLEREVGPAAERLNRS